jgi:hypothetical protein
MFHAAKLLASKLGFITQTLPDIKPAYKGNKNNSDTQANGDFFYILYIFYIKFALFSYFYYLCSAKFRLI